MKHTTYNQIAGQKPNRIEGLSDGVFSIAMTLLVLDLKVPAQALIHSEGDLLAALYRLSPNLLSYLLGFMTLGILWVGHTTQFTFQERSDRSYSWIQIFFLLVVGLLPFTTAFLSAHIQYRLAVGIYWLNILLAGSSLYASWHYSVKHDLLSTDATPAISTAIFRRISIAQLLYAIGASLCFINTYLSIGFILLIQLNYALGLTENRRAKS